MNQAEIIAIAKEAGFDMSRLPSIRAANVYGEVNDELAIFADLVAAKEREACAQLVQDKQDLDPYAGINGWVVADAIRARGQKEGV